MFLPLVISVVLAGTLVFASAPSGPWSAFNIAPASKVVSPKSIRESHGVVQGADHLVSKDGSTLLVGNDSWVTLDFGVEVGGLISLNFDNASSSSSISLSFTESPTFISPTTSDDSSYPSANTSYDGVLRVPAPLSVGHWTQPASYLRGGFRFLTIVSNSDDPVAISNVSCAISFMPHVSDLRDYAGYFYALDPTFHDKDFLTKIWYAGAYTVQTNTVPVNTGRQAPFVSSPGWANNATLGIAGPIIVDGAKRDMGIAVPTQFVSTNDLLPTKNALSTMFAAQNPTTGALPESGPPLSQQGSDTYHMWTLVGAYNYYIYSGDDAWLQNVWTNYTKAVSFIENKTGDSGLLDVTGLRDWGRQGGGGYSAGANALYYKLLLTAAELAGYMNEASLHKGWALNATTQKAAFNQAFWDSEAGMFRDNATTSLHPQDGNSLALLYNLTTTPVQAASVSAGLQKNWNDIGAIAPELPDNISPFISGFELAGHFASGNDARAMDLLQREWGYMLYTNISVQSTLLEGFTSNGSLFYRSYQGYNYDPSYTSHSHGWSSGPTSALTFYVAGLTVTAPQGREWSVAPHLSGLSAAEGGFETPLGWFGARWNASSSAFVLSIDVPKGTKGVVRLPKAGHTTVDGRRATVGGDLTLSLAGGKHSVSVKY
ncbi:glycoside hydrolase family 78 protein [Dentipellis sp. KUC8613]|nr:glycoside hydrolase family 78 protein [Dentipellis sp. KUC8613]